MLWVKCAYNVIFLGNKQITKTLTERSPLDGAVCLKTVSFPSFLYYQLQFEGESLPLIIRSRIIDSFVNLISQNTVLYTNFGSQRLFGTILLCNDLVILMHAQL